MFCVSSTEAAVRKDDDARAITCAKMIKHKAILDIDLMSNVATASRNETERICAGPGGGHPGGGWRGRFAELLQFYWVWQISSNCIGVKGRAPILLVVTELQFYWVKFFFKKSF